MTPPRFVLAFASMLVALGLVACMGELPPPPALTVTSPVRGLIESDMPEVTVQGRAVPGTDGSPVTQIMVNGKKATVSGDGSFTAVVPVPAGAMLIETVAISEEGGRATDARAVHVGQRRNVGTPIDRAVGVTLSAATFQKISETASQIINTTDLSQFITPISLGGSTANAKVTINQLQIANTNISLVPTAAGLQITVEVEGLDAGATVAYAGSLVPDGSTTVNVTADKIAIGGILGVTPSGTSFKATVGTPNVSSTALRLDASGLVGQILELLTNNLSSLVGGFTSRAAESALEPLINKALGALGGPKSLDLMGKTVSFEGSFSEVQFSNEGAMASLNVAASVGGGEVSPGYIYNPNGTPKLELGRGLQIALADDLLNDAFAQVHALGVLALEVEKDFGLFDKISIELTMPPMLSGATDDGSVRLVLGDMIVHVSNNGNTLVRAAVNAQVDVAVREGTEDTEIALDLPKAHVVVNLLDEPSSDNDLLADLSRASNAGVSLQLESLEELLLTVPVPTVKGITVDNLSLLGDAGYVVASGQIH